MDEWKRKKEESWEKASLPDWQSWEKASEKRRGWYYFNDSIPTSQCTYMHKSVLNQVRNPFARAVVKAASSNIFITTAIIYKTATKHKRLRDRKRERVEHYVIDDDPIPSHPLSSTDDDENGLTLLPCFFSISRLFIFHFSLLMKAIPLSTSLLSLLIALIWLNDWHLRSKKKSVCQPTSSIKCNVVLLVYSTMYKIFKVNFMAFSRPHQPTNNSKKCTFIQSLLMSCLENVLHIFYIAVMIIMMLVMMWYKSQEVNKKAMH